MSERVTWEVCPSCGRTAALGWLDEEPVEFDCTEGCRLTPDHVRVFVERRRPPRAWLTVHGRELGPA